MYLLPNCPTITFDGVTYYQIEGSSQCFINTSGAIISTVRKKWGFLTPYNHEGYMQTSIKKDSGGRELFYVHRLVAGRFLPIPAGKTDVNHIDGNKANNKVDNLEWVTKSENTRHAIAMGLLKVKRGKEHHLFGKSHNVGEETRVKMSAAKQGENHPKFKGWYQTPAGTFPSAQAAADALGLSPKTVLSWCKGGKKKAEGYDFIPATAQPLVMALAA